MANEIKKITLGGQSYEIWAPKADASGIQFAAGTNQIPEGALSSVPWSAASGLSAELDATNTTGFALAKDVASAINDKIGGVYKVMGSEDWANLTADDSTAKVNGNVYNLTAVTDGVVDRDGNKLYKGDNVVYVTAGTAGWDKLGTDLDLAGYATSAWTTGYIADATSAQASALWNQSTAYINSGLGSANSANATALWNDIVSTVNSGISAQVWDQVVTASGAMTAEANSGKIANIGATTAYIDDKIAETVAETIDIASEITDTTPTSAIPNVGALSSFNKGKYIEKNDITYDTDTFTLIIDNT